MADPVTTRYGLPLMQAAQAQKHVTLNEALVRLDGVSNLVVQQLGRTTPPEPVIDGACFAIGTGGVNAWSGQDGKIAIGSGGGWIFVPPTAGLRVRNLASGRDAVHNGKTWIEGALTLSPSGAGLIANMAEADVILTSGSSVTTTLSIPPDSMVVGCSSRVLTAIAGSATSWTLGVSGALDRFGKGMGKAAGSYGRGLLGSPLTSYSSEAIIVTATGGSFTGGKIRLALHYWELRLPD